MTVEIPADVQPIIEKALANGSCPNETEVLRRALRLYEEFERRRGILKQEVEKGINSGDSIPAAVVFQELEQLAAQLSHRPAATL